ncbi:hypothetical protein DUI87_18917 [Hirundo rustica rustica]|uniref:Centromere protein K n=1 Tax=Hirundo rustica rustica TaxID=333673 RepID=A0A3M0JTZ7_HIRRU|nr:hypothetical protein DUI87_18917 [Hirundo rustica rustica]
MAECLSEIPNTAGPITAKEELLDECESIWRQMEECQNKLMLLGAETVLPSDAKLVGCSPDCHGFSNMMDNGFTTSTASSLRCMCAFLVNAAMEVFNSRLSSVASENPELISTNPDVLLELGKEELQKVKNDLEMVLSTVRSKNKQLEEDLKREQQWYEEQKQMLDTLNKIEEEANTEVEQPSPKREFDEMKNKLLKLKAYKKELLSALSEFLDEHFPHPANNENINIEILINKLMSTPHEPYITIKESFWPPYIELLLRYGVALRHPEDPNRMRLQAFHK